MALLDVQRRGQQIGRLRIGQQVATKDGKMRPAKLDTFRFTTQSPHSAQAIGELFGGTVQEWNGQYEVITGKSAIGVTVPPRDQVISQHYEMWNKGGCLRRCDSQTEQISGKPCLCPHAEDPTDLVAVEDAAQERSRLAGMNPPRACKPVTRISVMIPDLPGLGVFRLDTGSYYAAVEIGDAAELLQVARDRGVFLPAVLRIEQRQRVAGGQTKKFPVPVLEVLSTFRQIASGALEAGGITAQLPPPPGQQPRALTAGRATPSTEQAAPQHPAGQPSALPSRPKNAQEVANLALKTTDLGLLDRLARLTRHERWEEDMVLTGDDVMEELSSFLDSRLVALDQPEGGAE
jgi:hypothetical protein